VQQSLKLVILVLSAAVTKCHLPNFH